MKLICILLCLVSVLYVSFKPINSSNNNMQLLGNPYIVLQNPVEQQTEGGATQPDRNLWVINNTGLPWDADDKYHFMSSGRLQAGESFEHSIQFVADWKAHLVGLRAWVGNKSSFKATIRIHGEHLDRTFIATNYLDTTVKPTVIRGEACCTTPDYDHESTKLISIPDSNGGVGQIYTITWKIINTGNKWLEGGLDGQFCATFSQYIENWCPCNVIFDGQREGYDPRINWCE